MTTSTSLPRPGATQGREAAGATPGSEHDLGAQVRTAAADAATAIAKQAPTAVAASRDTIQSALRTLQRSSSGSLLAGAVFASGVTAGMRLSRAPRMLVALAALPALFLGSTVLGRGSMQAQEPQRAEPALNSR